MDIITSILGILLTIFFIVGIHEFGHFIVARMCGIKVLKFSIGFGKSLYRWSDKKGTEYVLAAIPLGGYVKMLDQGEEHVPPHELHLAFNRQPLYKRLAVILAGPLFNFIFAFIIYWFIFVIGFTAIVPLIGKVIPGSIAEHAGIKAQDEIVSIEKEPTRNWSHVLIRLSRHMGDNDTLTMETQALHSTTRTTHILNLSQWKIDALKPDPLESLGIKPYEPNIPAVIGTIQAGSAAERAKLQTGDAIISIDNHPITDWIQAITIISTHPSKTLSFKIKRKNKLLIIPVNIDVKHQYFFEKSGFLGISPQFTWPDFLSRTIQYDPITALSHATQNTMDFIYLNFLLMGKMMTGKISLLSLGGPISIFQGAGTAFQTGILPFFSFLAFISIAIGVINILPIPGLDGGYLIFYCIELMTGRPVSPALQILFIRFGLILLMLLLAQAISNDIMRL